MMIHQGDVRPGLSLSISNDKLSDIEDAEQSMQIAE